MPLFRGPRRGRRGPGRAAASGGFGAGGLPPPVLEIPYSWIATPSTRKATQAITKAVASRRGGSTAYASAPAAQVRQFGANAPPPIDLDTATDADPANLAAFLVAFQTIPRPRQPTLTFNLLARTEAECLIILGVGYAQRIRITGAPAGTPIGVLNFVVQGISHTLGVADRTVTWSTAALIGTPILGGPAAPGPWFRLGSSSLGGTDMRPF